jgi:transcriptional regulator with XRE-family HTH domain
VETPSALARLRGRRGLTQRQLANLADLTIETISDIERGDTTRPQLATIRKLAAALEMDFDELVELLADTAEEASA